MAIRITLQPLPRLYILLCNATQQWKNKAKNYRQNLKPQSPAGRSHNECSTAPLKSERGSERGCVGDCTMVAPAPASWKKARSLYTGRYIGNVYNVRRP